MKQSNTNSFSLSFSLEYVILVSSVEASNVLILLEGERVLDCMYSERSLDFFSIHVWFMPLLEYAVSQELWILALIVDTIEVDYLESGALS